MLMYVNMCSVSEISSYYLNTLTENPGMSEGVAAIKTLLQLIIRSEGKQPVPLISAVQQFKYISVKRGSVSNRIELRKHRFTLCLISCCRHFISPGFFSMKGYGRLCNIFCKDIICLFPGVALLARPIATGELIFFSDH